MDACRFRKLGVQILVILFVVTGMVQMSFGQIYSSWTHSKDVVLNTSPSGADVVSTQTNFPVLVRLYGADFPAEAKSDGSDIRFATSDEATALSYEIEDWNNGASTAEIWVLVSSIQGNNATQYIKIYWGNASASDESNSQAVFGSSNGFVGAWHLHDNMNDATANNNTITNSGSADAACLIADGQQLDGSNDYLDFPAANMSAGRSELTLSMWVKVDESTSSNTIWDEYYNSNYWQFSIRQDYWHTRDASTGTSGSRDNNLSMPSLTVGSWTYLTFVYSVSGNVKAIYANGVLSNSTSTSIDALTSERDAARFGYPADGDNFDGQVDEIQFASVARSADWIKLAYENQRSSQTLVEFVDAATYTVSYNGNGATGGTVPTDGNSYLAGATVTVLGNTGNLANSGYTFAGWNTAANGTGDAYAGSQTFTMGSANVTLYAQWTSNPTYSVTYNANGATGGTTPIDDNAYVAGATVTVLENTGNLEQSGFCFAGWNTSADGLGTTYSEGATFTIGSANVTLYAVWNGGICSEYEYPNVCGAEQNMKVDGQIKCNSLLIHDWLFTQKGSQVEAPDYVFKKGYDLKSLKEIEAYITQHGHLPEVPNAAEFKEKGVDMIQLNFLLLKKIEEMTLHLIRQEKEIEKLKKKQQ